MAIDIAAFKRAFGKRQKKMDLMSVLQNLDQFGTQLLGQKFQRDTESRAREFQTTEREAGQKFRAGEAEKGREATVAQEQARIEQLQKIYGERVQQGTDAYSDAIETDDPVSYKKAIQALSGIPSDVLDELGGPKVSDVRGDFKDSRKRATDAQTKAAGEATKKQEAVVERLAKELTVALEAGDPDRIGSIAVKLFNHPGERSSELLASIGEWNRSQGGDGDGGGAGGLLSPAEQEKATALVGKLRDPVSIRGDLPEDIRGDVTSLATGAALGPTFSGIQDLVPVTATVTDEGFAAVAAYDAKVRSEKDLWEQEGFEPDSPHNINDEFNRTRMQQEAENELRREREAKEPTQPNILAKLAPGLLDEEMVASKEQRVARQVSSLMEILEEKNVFVGVTDIAEKKRIAAEMLARNVEHAKTLLEPLGLTVRDALNALGFDYAGN